MFINQFHIFFKDIFKNVSLKYFTTALTTLGPNIGGHVTQERRKFGSTLFFSPISFWVTGTPTENSGPAYFLLVADINNNFEMQFVSILCL